MKAIALVLAAAPLVQQAVASLNCTAVAQVTARACEWEGCKAQATHKVGDVLHAGCRADCSTLDDPWLQLYDGSFVRTNDLLANCRYFCNPYAITGLPTCAWEHNQTDPGLSYCAASSVMGLANKLQTTSTLGLEPSPFAGVPTAGSACDWTKTPATLAPSSTRRAPGGGAPPPPTPAPTMGATTTGTNSTWTPAVPNTSTGRSFRERY